MRPTEDLMNEHRAVERMLRILSEMATRLEAAREVEPEHLNEGIEFLQVFVDRCHHGKEEELLFPALEKAISREGEVVVNLLDEHRMGREAVRGMAKGLAAYRQGDLTAGRAIAADIHRYTTLLEPHIQKEDGVLFPLADLSLSAEQEQALTEGFETIERERIGEGRHEAFHEMLDRLEDIYLSRATYSA